MNPRGTGLEAILTAISAGRNRSYQLLMWIDHNLCTSFPLKLDRDQSWTVDDSWHAKVPGISNPGLFGYSDVRSRGNLFYHARGDRISWGGARE